MNRIGHGVFTWMAAERRTDRYGSFCLASDGYGRTGLATVFLDRERLRALCGKRVHVTCKVIASRESGHVGDLFHGFFPSRPDVGEVVDLGVGTLHLEEGFDGQPSIVLAPREGGRSTFWIDPRKLYRLHDQTVDLFIEETKKPFSPAPKLEKASTDEVIENGDGTFQAKGPEIREGDRVDPDVERLGDGLFVITPPSGKEIGKRRKIRRAR